MFSAISPVNAWIVVAVCAHHIGSRRAEVAGEEARHAVLMQFVELPRGNGDDAGGESLGAVGEFFARGLFVGEREGEMEVAAT